MAASITKLSQIYLKRFIDNTGANMKIVGVCHDEIIIESIKNHKLNQSLLIEAMNRGGKYFLKKVILKSDSKISKYWSH